MPAGGEQWDGDIRTLSTIGLKEISVVSAWPAYQGTEIALRARQSLTERDKRIRALKLAEAREWA